MSAELAVVYAALILQDDNVEITADKLQTLVKAAGIDVEPIWFSLYAKALQGQNLGELLLNVGAPGAGPAVAAGGAAAGGAADAPAEEAKEEEKEESDDVSSGAAKKTIDDTRGLIQGRFSSSFRIWASVSSIKLVPGPCLCMLSNKQIIL
ncbi:hypothetical protein [Absidia glauca]|uniref:60S acidic ribosomal protein P1 n=1 Tax=Absidia glauca TaxID=4829 RepID=A0A168NKM2_ABSGL|nr:hypothetical protein [Absidia glauca]